MRTIIAPTDFSKVSENACLYAAKLAAEIKADLILFHAMELPLSVAEYHSGEDLFNEKDIKKELALLKNKLNAETNNEVNITSKNIAGSPEHEIAQLCETIKPFAVVMGTHSYDVLDRFFVGSATLYAAKHLRYPVIIVPRNVKYTAIKKIALASDLQNIYEAPTKEIETIVKLFNAKFEVFYSAKNGKVISRNTIGSMMLNHRLIYLNPQFYFLQNEDVLTGITIIAKEHGIDLLIIIPKKHSPFHKSQAKNFVFYSDIPVIAIHENDYAARS